MPATSRSGECLRRRSSSGRAGSPSKSVMTKSFLLSSTWPEVVVAVVARLERAPGRHGQRVDAREHLLAAPEQRARVGGDGRRQLVDARARGDRAPRSASVVHALPSTPRSPAARRGLGLERRIAGAAARTRRAAPPCARPASARARGTRRARRAAPPRSARCVVEEAGEVVERVGPAVALVAHVRLQQRERRAPCRRSSTCSTTPASGTQFGKCATSVR